MAELADALDLGSSFARSEGSSPFIRIVSLLQEKPKDQFLLLRLMVGYNCAFGLERRGIIFS